MIVHGDKVNIIPVDFALENRDKYKKEGHEVNYVEAPGLAHQWAGKEMNDRIWNFFEDHPLRRGGMP